MSKTDKLKELIKRSLLLSEQNKKVALSQVDKATEDQIEQALGLFSSEPDRLKYAKKQNEKFLGIMSEFAKKAKAKLKDTTGRVIKKVESKSRKKELENSENLLK
ncbi:MAG: hypothetical protein NTZ25_05345 [Candidatus Peregrinibacteria bacterium]|nr:hypothetical protein [Candidatus Peregrinibacteria bacterium]